MSLILWRSGLGLVKGKYGQFLTELSAYNMKMAGYYRFKFLLELVTLSVCGGGGWWGAGSDKHCLLTFLEPLPL